MVPFPACSPLASPAAASSEVQGSPSPAKAEAACSLSALTVLQPVTGVIPGYGSSFSQFSTAPGKCLRTGRAGPWTHGRAPPLWCPDGCEKSNSQPRLRSIGAENRASDNGTLMRWLTLFVLKGTHRVRACSCSESNMRKCIHERRVAAK